MSDSKHAQTETSKASATKSNGSPASKEAGIKLVYVLHHQRISADTVNVTLNTRNKAVSMGMKGILLGVPGATVEVTRVFAGGAKARITFAGIDMEIQHHRQVVLEAGIGLTDANMSNGHFPHGSNPRAQLRPSDETK